MNRKELEVIAREIAIDYVKNDLKNYAAMACVDMNYVPLVIKGFIAGRDAAAEICDKAMSDVAVMRDEREHVLYFIKNLGEEK